MLQRFIAVARKEFIHVIRDWRSLVLAIAIPMLLIALFGYALTMDLKHVPTAVWDQSRTAQSRELLSLLDGSAYFSVDHYRRLPGSHRHARCGSRHGGPGDSRRFRRPHPGRPTGGDPGPDRRADANNATLAIGYINAIGQIYNRDDRSARLHPGHAWDRSPSSRGPGTIRIWKAATSSSPASSLW
jgi:ABC-2 type transport system permease protein